DEERGAKLEREKRSRVVDQALAFENVDNSFRQSNALGDRSGSDRIRRSHHSSKHQTHPPVESGKEPRRSVGHSEHRESDQSKSEKEHPHKIKRQLPPRGNPSGGKEQRRQDHEKDDIWIERYSRNSRNKAHQQPSDDEHNGIRSLQSSREFAESYDKEEQ